MIGTFLLLSLAGPVRAATNGADVVAAARAQVGVTTIYDPAYVRLAYPGGDVPKERGVCADVVVRALRTTGVDLQRKLHEDMKANFAAYPKNWGLKKPDPNIDHRRVPNLMTWFKRQGQAVAITKTGADYLPGDVVTWQLPGGLFHIGIVSDRKVRDGSRPLILHNIGRGAQEEDLLFTYDIIGHYRPYPAARGGT